MQAEASPSASAHLNQRYRSLIWSCLDADLIRSAVFYAERYYAHDNANHDAQHLYATALLRSGQPHSAHHLVHRASESRCSGCLELKAKCCSALGRHRQARDALEQCARDSTYTPTPSMGLRQSREFPELASLYCRSGLAALKGNLSENATRSFRTALKTNPMLWEAFEGLCSLGNAPIIDEIFPPRPAPTKPNSDDTSIRPIPVATGSGFFTPDPGSSGDVFRQWRADRPPPPLFRMDPPGPRDSIATTDSSFYPEDSFQHGQLRPSRSQPATSLTVQPPAVRPLSSADETGPAAKKPRSGTHQRTAPPSSTAAESNIRPSKSAGALLQGADDRSKSSKARARPALTIANIFSSPGRRAQHAATSSRSNLTGATKATREQQPPLALTRRSTRLLSGPGSKMTLVPKASKPITTRERRRPATRTRLHSDSEMEEDLVMGESVAAPNSPLPKSLSELSLSASSEQAAQEAYDIAMADYTIYNLIRIFATATRALAMYDCRGCLEELEKLPPNHQRSAWVMAMVGKAHYELGEYSAAQRAFEAVRNLEPYRLWDMEVYSTLLWHQQRNVQLSFLAQELLSIDPRSPQAWIAVGNCFSVQKERAQALTCFRRAAQLDPKCAYAYTLSGHESIDEDLDKAITFFQSALRADPRHYNAWYGLGTCYMRMSKLRLAEYHYRKAADIHPRNAVLLGCVGMVHERSGNLSTALALFSEAVRISPENALVRYHRAKIHIAMKRYALAVEDLESLRDTSPDESNVIFQLAKVYRLMGDKVKAAQLLAVARDVSPKSLNKIRKLLETVKDESAGDDVMDEG